MLGLFLRRLFHGLFMHTDVQPRLDEPAGIDHRDWIDECLGNNRDTAIELFLCSTAPSHFDRWRRTFYPFSTTAGDPGTGDKMSNGTGQALLGLITSDLLATGGAPLLTLLTNLKAHAGNGPLEAADILAFTATAPAAGLTFVVEIEQQLFGLAINKLQAYMNAKAAAAPAPAATGISG